MNFYQIPTPVKNEKYINELKQYYEKNNQLITFALLMYTKLGTNII